MANTKNAVWYSMKTQTLTDAANISWDMNDWSRAEVTITANRILDLPTNVAKGTNYELLIVQDGVGGHSLTLGAGFYNADTNPLTLDLAANGRTILSLSTYDSLDLHCVTASGFTLTV